MRNEIHPEVNRKCAMLELVEPSAYWWVEW
jgi:hypothetical protein